MKLKNRIRELEKGHLLSRLAILAVVGIDSIFDLSARFNIPPVVSNIAGLVLFGIIILTLLKFSLWKKREKKA